MPCPRRTATCTYMHTSACIHSPKMFLPVTHSTDTSKILDSAPPPAPAVVASACFTYHPPHPRLRPSIRCRRRGINKVRNSFPGSQMCGSTLSTFPTSRAVTVQERTPFVALITQTPACLYTCLSRYLPLFCFRAPCLVY